MNLYYKVVRCCQNSFRSIYNANPQLYVLNERIDCPYMFLYEPGQFMAEFGKLRGESSRYAVLEVEAIGDVHRVMLCDLSNSIDRKIDDPKSHIERMILLSDDESCNSTLSDSIIPRRMVSLDELKIVKNDFYGWEAYAPTKHSRKSVSKEMAS